MILKVLHKTRYKINSLNKNVLRFGNLSTRPVLLTKNQFYFQYFTFSHEIVFLTFICR
jgi:hypothetical protein